MQTQMTVGRTVRLKRQQHIPGLGAETIVVPSGGLYEILNIEENDTIRVQGIQRSGNFTPLGEHIWPMRDFELVDEG